MTYKKREQKFVRILESYDKKRVGIIEQSENFQTFDYQQQVFPSFKIGDHVLGEGDVFTFDTCGKDEDYKLTVYGEGYTYGEWRISVFENSKYSKPERGNTNQFSQRELKGATLISSPCPRFKEREKGEYLHEHGYADSKIGCIYCGKEKDVTTLIKNGKKYEVTILREVD